MHSWLPSHVVKLPAAQRRAEWEATMFRQLICSSSKQVVLWKLVDAVYTDCEKDGPFYVGQIKKMNLREFNNTPQVT